MSSYDPPADAEETQADSHDPGVQGREIVEARDLSAVVTGFDTVDYIKIGAVIGLPAGLLTVILVLQFVPDVQDTVGVLVRWLKEFLVVG